MDKNFLQDVVPPAGGKKSIRNIPIPDHRKSRKAVQSHTNDDIKVTRHHEPTEEPGEEVVMHDIEKPRPPQKHRHIHPHADNTDMDEEMDNEHEDDDFHDEPPHRKRRKGSKRKLVIGAVIIVLLFILLSAFSKAELIIHPKQATATVDASITISESEDSGVLLYKAEEMSESLSKSVQATGEEQVTEKATGEIVIFNAYSTSPQQLIKNTRFETPEGLIYRIENSITVPGRTAEKPGSIEVTVVADEAGNEYNIGLKDFTIPGFAGLEQFDSFYARSKTEMTGGYDGVRQVVSNSDVEEVENELQGTLTETLINRINTKYSEDYIVIYDSEDFSFTTSQGEGSGSSVAITVTAKIQVYILDKSNFSSHVAQEVLVDYDPAEAITIENLNQLETSLSVSDEPTIIVSGQPNFKWVTDFEDLAHSVADTNRSELKSILSAYPSISKADAVIKPFWKKSFPGNPEKITITEITE